MVDLIKIKVKAGDGGDGIVSWHHEKYRPKGGPDGGNGGNAGSIYIETDSNLLSLADLVSRAIFKAESGQRGGKNNCTGKSAEDLVIKVPVGTLIYSTIKPLNHLNIKKTDSKNGGMIEWLNDVIPLADLVRPSQRVLVAQGGVGGLGNHAFRSSTNQQPREHTLGTLGEERELVLELKILADVGLVGLPSSGKSTLLNKLTGASSRVGAYAFTTLEPALGVLGENNKFPLVIADLPGLIAGASTGRGLGDEFLRHIERCRVLVHLISAENLDNFENSYQTIRKELEAWSAKLSKKPEIVVLSKSDLLPSKMPSHIVHISAHTGEGLDELIKALGEKLQESPPSDYADAPAKGELAGGKVFTINNLPNKRVVFKK